MGYLLKEALKTLCGVNQWSYAVFWKIGCQNPKLLIWEEYYCAPAPLSRLPEVSKNGITEIPFLDYNAPSVTAEMRNSRGGFHEGDKVHAHVNKMMVENYVNVIGEGLLGRVAFTGNHQWILSENYCREDHPPQVLKEACQQFSAGIQTVAVIPVLPHGVIQFGSCLTIAENVGFVNNVVSLVLQLAHVPGFLQSENFPSTELAQKTKTPMYSGYSTPGELFPLESNTTNTSSFNADIFNYVDCSSQTSIFDTQNPFPLSGGSQNAFPLPGRSQNSFQAPPHSSPYLLKPHEAETTQAVNIYFPSSNQFMNGFSMAEVIPLNPNVWMNHGSTICSEQEIVSENGTRGHICPFPADALNSILSTNSGLIGIQESNMSEMETCFSDSVDQLTTNSLLSYCSQNESSFCEEEREQNGVHAYNIPPSQQQNENSNMAELIPGFIEFDRKQKNIEIQSNPRGSVDYGNACVQLQSGDYLSDILGVDFKQKLFNSGLNKNNSQSIKNMPSSEMYSTSQGNSDSGAFSFSGTDHLLDAVVSNVHPSASSALTNMSSSSTPNASIQYGYYGGFGHVKGELWGIPEYLANAGATSSSSLMSCSSKEDSLTFSQGGSSSIYDSWFEKGGQKKKESNNVAANKPNEMGKTSRKRLKPGENPRPRPKDRQMIQDRVKELRELVPNGEKCSIDALLERTIKHMLFLQSMTKHAEKLKQNEESKIISKDGGLLMKDNSRGATWAYEVGSQSMICPIIVEDLNQPHQMLVEMLCEERGLFLEIADLIRGLGLTILKGIMEARDDKIWARFAIEANRNVTRMEIFLALVRLLDQNAKSGVPQPNNIISNDNVMVQELHQDASVPSTGGSLNNFNSLGIN